jgi:hypothetical protein
MQSQGILDKMKAVWTDATTPIAYTLQLGKNEIALNHLIGQNIALTHTGKIFCIYCGRSIKKTFADGACYPCFQTRAETDLCIVRPHLCHHHLGTCRDNTFAQNHCFIPHVVYLAVSSGAKVGITREPQKFTRWADQGASYATVLAIVPNRKVAGDIEKFLSDFIADKTNWRKMLSPEIPDIDLQAIKKDLRPKLPEEFCSYLIDDAIHRLTYPVKSFPLKIKSVSFDKEVQIGGRLTGIKGQYLIFEDHVVNIRKHQGYEIQWAY